MPSHLKQQKNIKISEYGCSNCDKVIWAREKINVLTCPFCNHTTWLNEEDIEVSIGDGKLEELIKACESDPFEEGFGRIVKNGTKENAIYTAYNYYLSVKGDAKTPKEAVEKLLSALEVNVKE